MQVVLFGDFLQLGPIDNTNERARGQGFCQRWYSTEDGHSRVGRGASSAQIRRAYACVPTVDPRLLKFCR